MFEAIELLKRTRSAWIHHSLAPKVLEALYEMHHGDCPCEHPYSFLPYSKGGEFCSCCGEFRE